MNPKKYIPIIAAALVLIAVCLIFTLSKNTDDDNSQGDSSSDVVYSVITGPNTSDTINGISITPVMLSGSYSYCGEKILNVSVNCPQISSPDYNTENINLILRNYCDKFSEISESAKLMAEERYDNDKKYGIEFTVTDKSSDYICYRYGDFLSVHFNISQTAGATETDFSAKSFCFDLKKDEQVSLSEFFGIQDSDMLSIVESLFHQKIASNPEQFDSDAKERIKSEYNIYNFYLSKDGAIAYFPPYTISPGTFGFQSVTVKYE